VHRKNRCHVLRPDYQQRLLEQQGLGKTDCTDQVCGVVLGQVLSADFVVLGEILLRGEEVYIHASLIDVRKRMEKRSAHSILAYSRNARSYSKKAENMGYELLGKKPPGWKKGDYLLLTMGVGGALGYGYYYFTRTRYGTVEIVAHFP